MAKGKRKSWNGWGAKRDVRQFKGNSYRPSEAVRFPPPPAMLPPWAKAQKETEA
jgi:hypothetical protein